VDRPRARMLGRPEATTALSGTIVFMRMSGDVARNGDDRRDGQPDGLRGFAVSMSSSAFIHKAQRMSGIARPRPSPPRIRSSRDCRVKRERLRSHGGPCQP
jgi:hypothetical protein